MRSLVFESEAALCGAMSSGLIPADVQAMAAKVQRSKDGGVIVSSDAALSKATIQALTQAGVTLSSAEPCGSDVREVGCWAEAIISRRAADPDPRAGVVLFVVPDGTALLDLAAEMLRLGCERQEYRFLGDGQGALGLLRIVDPPYYTIVRALDGHDGVRAFTPSPAGQELVWTEIGFTHPLAATVKSKESDLLLIPGHGRTNFTTLPGGSWRDASQTVPIAMQVSEQLLLQTPWLLRKKVVLRLARAARSEATSLWVLRKDGLGQLDRLLQHLPDEIVGRLLFAVADDADEEGPVVLRARLGRQGPPELVFDVDVEAFAPFMQIGNLYVPSDAVLEPPLRRDRLRELLTPSPDRITWLASTGNGQFRPESMLDAAFVPLTDEVDYVVRKESRISPWSRTPAFDLPMCESIGGEWDEEKPDENEKGRVKPARARRAARQDPEDDDEPINEVEEPAPKPAPAPPRPVTSMSKTVVTEISRSEKELTAVERVFLDLDTPADDPERQALWVRMAELNSDLQRLREAGLCWTRVLWELSGAEEKAVGVTWAASERRIATSEPALITTLLGMQTPSREDVRTIAAHVVAGSPTVLANLHKTQRWLDAHDDALDVRSLWLAKLALSRLAGGDALGLVRVHDRLLARLARGLSVERDVPTFLRFSGTPGATDARGAGAAQRLGSELDELNARWDRVRRTRSAVEAPLEITRAYVALVIAYGFARLGQGDKAISIRDGAIAMVNVKDPVHGFLTRAYSVRIDHALEGLPAETPLPANIAGELNTLEKFLRYKVDRLRQLSTVLEPQERLDPVVAFQKNTKDLRGDEFASMRAIADPIALATEAEKLFKTATMNGTTTAERARLFDGLMDFFPLLPEAQAIPMLEELVSQVSDVEAPRRAILLEEALTIAGHFGRSEMVKKLVIDLTLVLSKLVGKHAAEVSRVLGACLRGLRRVGLRDEATTLLGAMASVATGEGHSMLLTRLQLAAGLAYIGRMDRAEPMFAEAREALSANDLKMPDRLQITRSLATALGHAPIDYAIGSLAKLSQQLPQITDSFNTNSHFCLSVVNFMESLVLGYASDELALGELGRRWLDEDEYLVRRRIHRDLAEGSGTKKLSR